jgi:lipid II:glycine glycyltransferase (peptidoglycan interpeptide bridge formation enzyme)
MAETGARDHFAVHDNAYYDAAFDLLTPEHAVYLLAEYADAPLAAIVVALAGDTALYLWGASSERERNRMPNHALQWAGMQWAKAHGAARYDLWGIPDPVGQVAQGMRGGDGSGAPSADLPLDVEAFPDTGLWGVYRFKQGFGGDVVRFIGAWDLPVDPVGYRVYSLGLGVYARLKAARAERTAAPSTAELTPVAEAGAWRELLAGLPAPHILQSWEWGAIKGQTEWRAERYALRTPAGSAAVQLLWRQLSPYAPVRVAYVPKGPVMDWANQDLVDATLAAVEMQARRLGCIFVKIDPDVREDTTTGRLVLHALERRGWRFSAEQIQFKNTACSDLRAGEDALLAGMKSKWRYNVRLAEKRGITVRLGAAADLPAFYDLYAETGARDGFLIRPFAYYRTTWATLLDAQADKRQPCRRCAAAGRTSRRAGAGGGAFSLPLRRPRLVLSTAPAANAAAATCPTTCSNGRRCAGRWRRAARSMTGGARRHSWMTRTTGCRASGSSSRALALRFSHTSARGILWCRPWATGSTARRCRACWRGCGSAGERRALRFLAHSPWASSHALNSAGRSAPIAVWASAPSGAMTKVRGSPRTP